MAEPTPDKPKASPHAKRHRGKRDPTAEAQRQLAAQDKARVMVANLRAIGPVHTILPIWQDAAQDVARLRRTEQPDGGRHGLLADESAISAMLQAIDAGLSPTQAAQSLAINPNTIKDHITQGERDIEQGLTTARAAFTHAAKMATERRRQRLLGGIESASTAGPQFWTAGAWLLERGYGNDYKVNQPATGGQVIVNVGVIGAADVRIGGEQVSIPDSHAVTITHGEQPVIDVTPTV